MFKYFDKKSEGANKTIGGAIKSKIMLNQQWANEFHKSFTRKLKKC